MNESIKMSPEIDQLAKSLAIVQGQMPSVEKKAENPFFKSKYADIADIIATIKKPLYDNGLSIIQLPSGGSGATVSVTTLLLHISGQWVSGTLNMTAKDASPQAIGSCITYARRYSLSAVLNIATESDDDGNHASTPNYQTNNHVPATKPPQFSPNFATPKPNDYSKSNNANWQITFGKYKGKTLDEVSLEDIDSYARYLASTETPDKPLKPFAREFIERANAYLDQVLAAADSQQVKGEKMWDNDVPPLTDNEIPF